MSVLVYVDANIWVSAADDRAPAKQAAARAWLKRLATSNTMIVSPQVATEHHSVAQRKLKLPADTARRASHAILAWADAPLTRKEVTKAIDLAQAHQLSWWDSLHIASALAARCSHLLTEDAQSTGAIEGLVFLDPFAAGPDALGLGV